MRAHERDAWGQKVEGYWGAEKEQRMSSDCLSAGSEVEERKEETPRISTHSVCFQLLCYHRHLTLPHSIPLPLCLTSPHSISLDLTLSVNLNPPNSMAFCLSAHLTQCPPHSTSLCFTPFRSVTPHHCFPLHLVPFLSSLLSRNI